MARGKGRKRPRGQGARRNMNQPIDLIDLVASEDEGPPPKKNTGSRGAAANPKEPQTSEEKVHPAAAVPDLRDEDQDGNESEKVQSEGRQVMPKSDEQTSSAKASVAVIDALVNLIDTPPASVQDENSEGLENNLDFGKNVGGYFQQNRLLHELHRERLRRAGKENPYSHFDHMEGYKSSRQPWDKRTFRR